MSDYRIRKVTSRGTPSHQLGDYEMQSEKGKRRSVFKVNVHLGEYATTEEALHVWPREVDHQHEVRWQGPGGCGKGDDAACPRLSVVAP
jgi:hypothetical protein